jgi:CheY-like chemotaxis protein
MSTPPKSDSARMTGATRCTQARQRAQQAQRHMTDSSPGLPRLFLTAASTLELVAVGAARGHHHHLCHPGEPALYKRAAAAVSLGAGQWLTAATTSAKQL